MKARRPPSLVARIRLVASAAVVGACSWPVQAHLKWFDAYDVGTAPRPISETLTDPWVWFGFAIALALFLAGAAVERTRVGCAVLATMNRWSKPLWQRADGFMHAMIASYFVAIFAIGGLYLTPDLETQHAWIPWMQLLIAAGLAARITSPLSAAGILALWVLALRDYDFFHMTDYLPIVLGLAAYFVLGFFRNRDWRNYRFAALRLGLALTVIWSSLEKFAFPSSFYPLLEKHSAVLLGMPPHVYVPLAGVTEFVLALGLMWTPLTRRLSAIALLLIFNLAVFSFGRMDFIGHVPLVAMLVLILVDPEGEVDFFPSVKRRLIGIPIGVAAAVTLFFACYWGLHALIYG